MPKAVERPESKPHAQTNIAISARLGITHAMVSRIRSGDRYPSRAVMRRIETAYCWPIQDQMALLPDTGRNLDYALEFEKRLSHASR